MAEVNGLGDHTEVRLHADGVAPDVATYLAEALRTAWQTAARALTWAETDDGPFAQQPDLAEVIDEQLTERYGPPPPADTTTPKP